MRDSLKELISVLEGIVDRLEKKEILSDKELLLATDAKIRLDVAKALLEGRIN